MVTAQYALCRYASDFYTKLALGHDPAALTVAVPEEEDCPATPGSRGNALAGTPGGRADSATGRALMLPLSPGSRSPDLRCVACS